MKTNIESWVRAEPSSVGRDTWVDLKNEETGEYNHLIGQILGGHKATGMPLDASDFDGEYAKLEALFKSRFNRRKKGVMGRLARLIDEAKLGTEQQATHLMDELDGLFREMYDVSPEQRRAQIIERLLKEALREEVAA